MEPIEMDSAGSQIPAEKPIQKKHDDQDILNGCPRSMTIAGIMVKKKAWRNNEFSTFGSILVHLGLGACQTPEEVDALTVEEIYQNCILNTGLVFMDTPSDSFEASLYQQMEWPEDTTPIPFETLEYNDLLRFFEIVVEQNNLIFWAKKNYKMLLRNRAAQIST